MERILRQRLRDIASFLLYLCLGAGITRFAYLFVASPDPPPQPDSRSLQEHWREARYIFVLFIFGWG